MRDQIISALARLEDIQTNLAGVQAGLRDLIEPAPTPEPEPEPARPVLPPTAPPVLRWRECKNIDGLALGPLERGLANVRCESHGTVIVGKVNAFAGSGVLEVDGYEVGPGYGRWEFAGDIAPTPDPMTATRTGRQNAQRHRVDLMTVNGLQLAGTPDANAPGGQGIYAETEWASGCAAGVEDNLKLCLGWANRTAIWRWDRDAYAEGRIEPHQWGSDFPGLDQTRTFMPVGYEGPKRIEGAGKQWTQLDHAHLVRFVHPARGVAQDGYSFGELATRALADDVIACWTTPNTSDSNLYRSHWWSCDGIERFTPANIGTPHAGRQFNGAMQALAAALDSIPIETDPSAFDRCGAAVDRLMSFVSRMIDEDRSVLYVIRYLDEAGKPSSKWQHKMQESFGNTVPDGETPDIYKGFEHSLVYLGLRALARCDWPTPLAGKYASVLGSRLGRSNAQLEVIDHPEWSSPKQSTWDEFISGQATKQEIDAALAQNTPWWAGHPLQSYTGDLR